MKKASYVNLKETAATPLNVLFTFPAIHVFVTDPRPLGCLSVVKMAAPEAGDSFLSD